MIKKYIYILLFGLISVSCASQASPKTEVKSPVQAQAQPAPQIAPKPAEQEAAKSLEPEISPELKDLREAIKSGSNDVEAKAHAVVDKSPEGSDAAEALRVLATLAIQDKNVTKALLYADAANAAQADSLDNLLLLAEIAHLQQRDSDAVKYYKKCTELSPNDSRAYHQTARILLGYLDTERALTAAAKAYELDAKSCEINITYADTLYANQKFEDAANIYVQAQSLCPLPEPALKNLAKLYEINLQDAKKACDAYTKLADQHPDNPYYKASRDYQCGL